MRLDWIEYREWVMCALEGKDVRWWAEGEIRKIAHFEVLRYAVVPASELGFQTLWSFKGCLMVGASVDQCIDLRDDLGRIRYLQCQDLRCLPLRDDRTL